MLVMFGLLRTSKAELSRVENELARLSTETTSLSRQIEARARMQFDEWQKNEIASIREQQREIATREALLQHEDWKRNTEDILRRDAISRSRSVTTGKVTEQMVPYFTEFPFNPKDARFIGSPIDFVVFDGLNDGEVKEVVIVEVKTASSTLSKREKQIREVVQARKIQWKELRLRVEDLGIDAITAHSDGSDDIVNDPAINEVAPRRAVPIQVPHLGAFVGDDAAQKVVLVHWHILKGDYVALDQALYELESDRATIEITSPVAGYLAVKLVNAGAEVAVGDTIAIIDSSERPAI